MKLIGLAIAAIVTALPAAAAERAVVLELFTSQGCSSCPPADAVLQEIAREPGVIALSRPVDYWDNLGWEDTLARPENTAKQRAYARALPASRGVYTPQLVVDGTAETVGSNESSVRRLIADARTRAAAARVEAVPAAGGAWQVTVSGADGADVHLIGYVPNAHVVIGAGENEGREIDYTNAVKSDAIIGTAGPEPLTTPDLGTSAPGMKWVIVVQSGDAGPIAGGLLLGGGS